MVMMSKQSSDMKPADQAPEGTPSTGETILYLTPGLRVAAPASMSAYAFVQVPAYRFVNEAQLTPRVALLVGWSKIF